MSGFIRLAAASDAGVLADLNAEIQVLHAQLSPFLYLPVAEPESAKTYFAGVLGKEEYEVALFVTNGDVVGYVMTECQSRDATAFTKPWRRLFIHHLAVAERARRQGVATSLMRWVELRARELNIELLALDHLANNSEAGSFYDHLGFAQARVVRLKTLAKDS